MERDPRAKLATLKIRTYLFSYGIYCSEQGHRNGVLWVMRLLKYGGLLKCLGECEARGHGIRRKVDKHKLKLLFLRTIALPSLAQRLLLNIDYARQQKTDPVVSDFNQHHTPFSTDSSSSTIVNCEHLYPGPVSVLRRMRDLLFRPNYKAPELYFYTFFVADQHDVLTLTLSILLFAPYPE